MNEQIFPKLNAKLIIGVVFYLLYTPLVLFLTSWNWGWGMAWVYSVVAIVFSVGGRVLMARKHPELVAERASYQNAEGVKEWDKKLVPLIAQIGPLVMLIIAGLDKRFEWSPALPVWALVLGFIAIVLGGIFSSWALMENRFFSSVVRIQTERGHQVCKTGPYKIVRHPGYAGGLLWYLMTPLMLGTLWAYIPTGIVVALTVLRTYLEDQTLQDELPGYKEYTQETKYRLLPGIW